MNKIKFFLVMVVVLINIGCQSQNENKMEDKNNPLLCDPQEGVCAVPGMDTNSQGATIKALTKPVKIIYFTDPICSSCWGIEPQLRKLKLEYSNSVEIDYHMGGLLPDWSYNSGGISKPSDVAHHWDEVSLYYKMPIDGDVWLEDPLHSSYPPSIAFKAAQMQDKDKAVVFMRVLREMVFLQKKNITKWEHLSDAASVAGLDVTKLKHDYENDAKSLFQKDLELGRSLGVRGFPTVIITDTLGNKETVYGFKPYGDYEKGIAKVYSAVEKVPYDKSWSGLFAKYSTLTAREFAELSEQSIEQAEQELDNLTSGKKLSKLTTKNGSMWSIKQ
jgi:putative protein-disulfide isomerase